MQVTISLASVFDLRPACSWARYYCNRCCLVIEYCLLFLGISGKSQILFSIVYTTRYLDLLTTYVSTYNTVMKLVFIVASYATVYLMYIKFKATYDHNHDTFRIEFLLIPTLILALLLNHEFTVMEVSSTTFVYKYLFV